MLRMFAIAAAILSVNVTVSAQEYTKQVVARDLKDLAGITVSPMGRVFFTSTPAPKVGGERSRNTVNSLNLTTGKIRTLVTGEAEPTALATTAFGDLYWIDRSAGRIRTLDGERVKTVAQQLDVPTGLAAYPLGLVLYVTEIPTPSENPYNQGRNLVSGFVLGVNIKFTVDDLDTQPTDVAVDLDGTVYWTNTELGIIVKRSVGGGSEIVVRDLKSPTGLATDYLGNLYFTELPNPGNTKRDAPKNTVSRLNLSTKQVTVISEGDPNPIDVGVSLSGRVYWADRTDGLIMEATRVRR